MRIEKIRTFLAPEGQHVARIDEVQMVTDDRNGACKEGIKFIFEITSIEHHTRTYMARKVYWEADSKALLHDLEELLGDNIGRIISLGGDILGENLSILINRKCEIVVVHVNNPKHKTPFCKIAMVKKLKSSDA